MSVHGGDAAWVKNESEVLRRAYTRDVRVINEIAKLGVHAIPPPPQRCTIAMLYIDSRNDSE